MRISQGRSEISARTPRRARRLGGGARSRVVVRGRGGSVGRERENGRERREGGGGGRSALGGLRGRLGGRVLARVLEARRRGRAADARAEDPHARGLEFDRVAVLQ